MKWSWKLIRLAGIDVYVHATFFILIAWLGLSYWQVGGEPGCCHQRCRLYPGAVRLRGAA
jgi:hypothetical protein